MKTIISLRHGPLDGRTHTVTGRVPDRIERGWEHSSSRHIYELCRESSVRLFYLHVKSYRPATQDSGR